MSRSAQRGEWNVLLAVRFVRRRVLQGQEWGTGGKRGLYGVQGG